MNFSSRWVRRNGGRDNLYLYRKIVFWHKYMPFSNKLHTVEAKMEKHAKELEKLYHERCELLAEREQINKDIDNSRETEEHYGPVTVRKLKLFRPKRVGKPGNLWLKFINCLRSPQSLAEQLVDGPSTMVSSYEHGNHGLSHDAHSDVSVVGSRKFDVAIKRDNSNNRKKNNQNNQNNQNNNH